MTTKPAYAPPGSAGIPNLDPFFGPDAPPLPDAQPPDDLMLQNPDIHYALQILYDLVVGDRTDVFIDTNSIVYYDPTDRNRRVQPDVYIAFDVDADAIRHRNGYVIWEVASRPISCLKWRRSPLPITIPATSVTCTPGWVSRNTGGLTARAGNCTGRGWPGSTWKGGLIVRFLSAPMPTERNGVTARCCASTCAGGMAGWNCKTRLREKY